MKDKIVIVSGYFNPIHKGHLELLKNGKELSGTNGKLVVIVNSDLQRELKGSKEFMDEQERLEIIKCIRYVDLSIISKDKDRTQCETLRFLKNEFPSDHLVFANGGDQNNDTIPERVVCEELGIELIDGLGDKVQSSSWLLNK